MFRMEMYIRIHENVLLCSLLELMTGTLSKAGLSILTNGIWGLRPVVSESIRSAKQLSV